MVQTAIIKLHGGDIRELLRSPEMKELMGRYAQKIQEAAGGAPDFEVEYSMTDRWGASVVTATWRGKAAEANSRALTRAIDAGRD